MNRLKVFAGILLLAAVFNSNLLAGLELPSGKILFVVTEKAGVTYLAASDPFGKEIVPISPKYNNIMYPRVCHATAMIGFTNKKKNMNSEVYLIDLKAKKAFKILDGAAFEGFSPNGKFILYTSCTSEAGLYLYNIETKSSKLVSKADIISASWSKDNKWIAASVLTKSGKTDLIKISLANFKTEKITNTATINESFPVFTADGRYMAFCIGRDRNNRVAFFDIEKKSIYETPMAGRNPSASPDNKWVVFENNNSICIGDKDGKRVHKVAAGKTPIWFN